MTRDRVSPELHAEIIRRDRTCLMYLYDAAHVCRDKWGAMHSPTALHMLTVEHVHEGYGMAGKRAKSDARHMVALCHGANVGVPSKEARAFFRDYLDRVNAMAY